MITRIEIFSKVQDTRAKVKKNKFENLGFKKKIQSIWLANVYTIDKVLNHKQIEEFVSSLTNSVSQISFINNPYYPSKFDYAIEVGFLPGVTDNVGNTAKEIAEDLLKVKFTQEEGIYTSTLFLIKGDLSKKEIKTIAEGEYNPLIQRVQIKNYYQYKKEGMEKIVPKVKLDLKPNVDEVNLNVGDEELIKIGKLGIANKNGARRGPLALDLTYMKTVQSYFKNLERNPTDIELESIAQTWSEHCKHTIFADPIDEIKDGLFKAYIKKSTDEIRKKKGKKDFCVSVFNDNSGAIEFNKNYLITHKVETHNSPSALDPFGGAITGIVGVNRDAIGFGLGAKPIANTYGYCFADPKINTNLYRDPQLSQKLLSPRRIMNGVIEGVNAGGNCSGIPTPQGFMVFDQRYQGKPLVFVGTLGLIPKKNGVKKCYEKKAKPEDLIVMIGGRVGQDGIHGATFSSEALDSGSPATAVQIGDPITQKKMSDAIVKEARDLNLYHSITDNGAGGLSCSVAEMAKESDGCIVDLEKVPLKYPGLEPWKIWISESQERMTLAVPKNKWEEFETLMKKREVEATIIGKFTNSGRCIVKNNNKVIMNLEMDFLHNGLPPRTIKTQPFKNSFQTKKPNKIKNLNKTVLEILSSLNISSFEFISMQYDHEVQSNSVIKPLQGRGRVNSDAAVIKPILNSKKAVAVSQGIYPTFSDIDTYHMSACCIDTAIRNLVAVGADINKIALLDNFCWCSSNNAEKLYQLKKSVQACYDYASSFCTPFISGKDSMFNDFKGFDENGKPKQISVPPTLLVSSIGLIDDALKVISIDFKQPEDLIYVLGETNDELGGSEFYTLKNIADNNVPKVDALKNKKLYQTFHQFINKGLITSAISINRGGLVIALAKMSMASLLGANVSLKKLKGNYSDNVNGLFSESQGRIIATINPKNKIVFEKTMVNNTFSEIGKVTKNKYLKIRGKNNKNIVNLKIEKLLKAYKSTFKNY